MSTNLILPTVPMAKSGTHRKFILATEKTEARAIPMSLEGYPKEIEGQPVEYRRKEVSRAGSTVHDNWGNPFPITRDRLDKWAENTNKYIERGGRVFVPTKHTEILSSDNRGFVLKLEREGDSLYATQQLIGKDAMLDLSRNDQSTYIVLGAEDDQGNQYDEIIQHIALTPCPAVSGLNGFAKVAASRGADAEAVILYATPEMKGVSMQKDMAQKLRKKLGVADDVGDEKLVEQVFTAFLADPKPDPAQVAAMSKLTEERDALIKERDDAKGQVVAMSRLNPKVDEDTAFLVGESILTKRDIAIKNGAVSPAVATELDKLLMDGDKANVVAMSRLPGSAKPLAMRFWEALADNKPTAYGEKTGRQHAVAMSRQEEEKLPGSAGEQSAEAAEEEGRKQGEAWREEQLRNRGMAKV